MIQTRRLTTAIAALVLAAGLLGPLCASAAGSEEPKKEKDWEVTFTPYVVIAGISGQLSLGPVDKSIGIGFEDLLGSIQGMMMADLTLRYKRVGVIADGLWVTEHFSHPTGNQVYLARDVDLSAALGTGAVFFRFRPMKGLELDPYMGSRWWRVSTQIEFRGSGLPQPLWPPPLNVDITPTWADFVVGARLRYNITDRWYVQSIADVGGGSSKVSWQYYLGGGFGFTDWFGLDLGYRIVGVDYQKDGFEFDAKVHGFQIGFQFTY